MRRLAKQQVGFGNGDTEDGKPLRRRRRRRRKFKTGRVRDEVGERGEAEVKEENVREWGFGKWEIGNGSGSESESESEVGLQLHFLLALLAFPPNFNYYCFFII